VRRLFPERRKKSVAVVEREAGDDRDAA